MPILPPPLQASLSPLKLQTARFDLAILVEGCYGAPSATMMCEPAMKSGLWLVASEQEVPSDKRDSVGCSVLKKPLLRMPYVLVMPYAGS